MEYGLSKPLSLWPRSEVFSFGVFPMQPHPRLSISVSLPFLHILSSEYQKTDYICEN